MTCTSIEQTFSLVVPGEPHSLALIRAAVSYIAALGGFDQRDVNEVEVAVDEACSNILEHSFRDLTPKPEIIIEMLVGPGQIVIEVMDHGQTFDPTQYASPTFPDHWEQGNTRGVGMYLIRACMDEVTYEQAHGARNRLRMIKAR